MATNAPRAQGKIMMVGSLPFEKRLGNRTDIRRIAEFAPKRTARVDAAIWS